MINKISGIISFIFFVLVILFADIAKEGALNGLNLALRTAVPALFPFFVASTLLSQTGVTRVLGKIFSPFMNKVYGLSGECSGVLVLGFTGGYPVGVSAACELYKSKRISKNAAEKLLGFCNNTGPAFIVGICGAGILGSVKLGLWLYFIHIASALICGKFFSFDRYTYDKISKETKNIGFSQALVNGCEQAAQTSIKITAFLTFFSILIAFLKHIGINLPDVCYAVLYGFFELTYGLTALKGVYIPVNLLICIMSAMLAFGGLSVMCQALSIVKPLGLSFKYCIIGKILHSITAFILSFIITSFLPFAVSVSDMGIYMPELPMNYMPFLCIFILYILTNSKYGKNKL